MKTVINKLRPSAFRSSGYALNYHYRFIAISEKAGGTSYGFSVYAGQ